MNAKTYRTNDFDFDKGSPATARTTGIGPVAVITSSNVILAEKSKLITSMIANQRSSLIEFEVENDNICRVLKAKITMAFIQIKITPKIWRLTEMLATINEINH